MRSRRDKNLPSGAVEPGVLPDPELLALGDGTAIVGFAICSNGHPANPAALVSSDCLRDSLSSAGTMPLVWVERPTWPFLAATRRQAECAKTPHRMVGASCVRLSGW